jgi:hypothetical protein
MKNFLIALVLAILLLVGYVFGVAAYRVYIVYPSQHHDAPGCRINQDPIQYK